MLNQEDIDRLLLKYLLHETTPAENQTVETWLAENPQHQHYFTGLRNSHLQVQAAIQSDRIEGNYNHFRQKMHRRTLFRRLSRLAAMILLVLGSGLCYLLVQRMNTSPAPISAETIQPGSTQAILHLSSGKAVPVNTKIQQLKEQDGTVIQITDEGVIDYSASTHSADANLTNRLEIPRGGEYKLSLADGTEVWLNSETELQYPTSFTSTERKVKLNGEAYFKVARNENRPFIVEVGDIKIKVYGTQFNINTQYTDRIETVLVSGSVGIQYQGKETFLKPSQKAAYRSSGKLTVEDVDVLPYTTWKDGNFMFRNETLESIMEKLARWYDLEVFYSNEKAKEIRLSGMMERYKNAGELFHYFEKISTARFSIKGRTVTIQ